MSSRNGNESSSQKPSRNTGRNITQKKQRMHICKGCYWRFSSREKLVEHMLSEREGSQCRSALQRCPHCEKYWPTEESLDAHLRNDSKCKRAENIPFTISFLKTNVEQPTSVPDKRQSTRDISQAINVTHHGLTEQRKIQRTSKLCEKKLSSKPSPSEIAMAKQLNDFRLEVKINPQGCRLTSIKYLLKKCCLQLKNW